MVLETLNLINTLILKGSEVTFCWIPSHSGFYYNNRVDIAAKRGASQSYDSKVLSIPLSTHECFSIIDREIWKSVNDRNVEQKDLVIKNVSFKKHNQGNQKQKFHARSIMSLRNRWNVNAFKTKYVKNVACVCRHKITREHILNCNAMRQYISPLQMYTYKDIFSNASLSYDFLSDILLSPLGLLLYFFFLFSILNPNNCFTMLHYVSNRCCIFFPSYMEFFAM